MSDIATLRKEIADLIGITVPVTTSHIEYSVVETAKEDGYTRQLIEYDSYGDKVIAFLLLPDVLNGNPAVLINHQHNSERHLGKSEVCGLTGDPLQAFGPELAKRGFVVLAPDSVCFEDRRRNAKGTAPAGSADMQQHLNEMCYRILRGELLIKKVLEDAISGISLLLNLSYVDGKRIGTMGHSYGGSTVLFHSALDERIAFSCASGSAGTLESRIQNNVGIEFSSVIPGFHGKYDIDDLAVCIAPRRLFIVSADDDKYSKDAPYIVERAGAAYAELGASENLQHKRFSGGHALTKERFDCITEWVDANGKCV